MFLPLRNLNQHTGVEANQFLKQDWNPTVPNQGEGGDLIFRVISRSLEGSKKKSGHN